MRALASLQVDGEAAMDGDAGGVELMLPTGESSMSNMPTPSGLEMVMFCDAGELPGLWYDSMLRRRSMILLASFGTAGIPKQGNVQSKDTSRFGPWPAAPLPFQACTLESWGEFRLPLT